MSIPLCRPFTGEEEALAMARVLASGHLVQGEQVRAFEAGLSALLAGQEVAAVSSGTAALHLALMVVGVRPGDEVVVPALTFPAPANVAALLGARVVPVDIDADTCNLDVARLAAVVSPRTRAVVVVHQFGVPADVAAVRRVVGPGVAVVEDAACALGATTADGPCGTLGDVACFSFHPRKVVTTGEGGALTSPDPALVERARVLRNHGMGSASAGAELPAGRFVEPGWNLRMSDLHAAVGVVQLGRLPAILAARRALAERYRDALGDAVRLLPGLLRAGAVPQSLVVELPAGVARGELLLALAQQGVEATIASYALHRLPALRGHCGGDEAYPVATRLHERGVTLPLFPALSAPAVDDVARILTALLRRNQSP